MEKFKHANYHGQSNKCNWCGSEKISKERTCLISDLPHTIYTCESCSKRSSKKKLAGNIIWRPAIKEKNQSGVSKHIIAGKK